VIEDVVKLVQLETLREALAPVLQLA